MPAPDPLATPLPIPLSFVFQEPGSQPAGPTDQQGGGAAPGGQGTTGQPGGAGGQPGGTGQPGAAPCGTDMVLMMGVFLALMYFMILRPESKRRKQTQNMLQLLKSGDHVVTIGGMHGTVQTLTDKEVTVQVDGVQMLFDRTAIARVVRDEPAAGGKS